MLGALCNCICIVWAFSEFVNRRHGTAWNWADIVFAVLWGLNAVYACFCVIKHEISEAET